MFATILAVISMGSLRAQPDDFKIRGFHLDLRIQVMTPQALRAFAKELAGLGINTLVMEYEAAYPYKDHATITNKLAYTREEVSAFVTYCNGLGIDVIPLQQCFGHVEYILEHDRYAGLREDAKDLSQVCPDKRQADSLLFAGLFADMASLHPSKYLHIGGDETRLLGHCPLCSKKAATEGRSKLFVDYMRMMCNIVLKMGKIPVMWADILLQHPEAAGELPMQTIFIDWNYGWKPNFFGDIDALQKKGLTFWGAPALRSHPDDWYVTCWKKHFDNLHDFIPYSRSAGYKGMVMTSWSTSGVYDLTWGVDKDVINMQQIRNTYPLAGFRILVEAYAQALKQQAPIDGESFVETYSRQRFGFDEKGGKQLWQALTIQPGLIVTGKPAGNYSIAQLRAENRAACKLLAGLKPVSNKQEFEHFRLMADLRDYYLAFKTADSEYNSNDFTAARAKQLLVQLDSLRRLSKDLDQRFYDLHKGYLYDQEIWEQNRLRNEPVNRLYERLAGARARLNPSLEGTRQDPGATISFPRQQVVVQSLPDKKNVWVFLMAGQSNMAGRALVEPEDTLPDPRIFSVNKEGQLIVAKEPLHFYQPMLTGLDCGMSFARTLLPHLPQKAVVLLVPCAVGGSAISYWLNDSTYNGMHLKTNFMEKVQLAKKYGTIKGILWHQGESDGTSDRIPLYENRLKQLFDFFRQYTGNPRLPVVAGELGAYAKRPEWKTNWAEINKIIEKVVATEKNCSLVKTADLTPKEDFIHFDSRSQRLLGQRYAAAYLSMQQQKQH